MIPQSKAPRVCIIGGGPAGLASLRFISSISQNVVLFEAKEQVGGMWLPSPYSELTHPNLDSDVFYKYSGFLHSSMYSPLTTNLPFPSLSFVGFPFSRTSQSQDQKSSEYSSDFLSQQEYLSYIQAYCSHFQLEPYIRLGHFVKSVRYFASLTPEQQDALNYSEQPKFVLEVISVTEENQEQASIHLCDYLIVTNGHYSSPYLPQIEWVESRFKGTHFHMHNLRSLEKDTCFPGKKVLIVGYRYGGMDLVQNLLFKYSDNYRQLHVSTESSYHEHSADLSPFIKSNKLSFHKRIVSITGPHKAEFQDGEILDGIDVIIWATGYQFSYPFFNQQESSMCDGLLDIYARRSQKTSASKSFGPLFLRSICGRQPNLMFGGLVTAYGNGMVYDYQAMLFASIISKTVTFSPQCLLQLAEQEATQFREKVPSMMKYLQFTSHFTPFHYMNQLQNILGFDPQEQEQPCAILKEIMDEWISHFKAGDFRKVKQIQVSEKYLKEGVQFQWRVPSQLFKTWLSSQKYLQENFLSTSETDGLICIVLTRII